MLQGDTLAPFLFIVALDCALRRAIEGNEEELGFTLQKRASRRVVAKMVTDLDFFFPDFIHTITNISSIHF